MMRLDQKTHLAIDSADQGIQGIDGNVDDGVAVGALQMGVRLIDSSARRGHSEVVNRSRASNVSVGDQTKIAQRRQSTVNRGPMDSGSRCLCASDDLVRCQVIISGIQHLDDGLAGACHPLVLLPQQHQGGLDAWWGC